MPYNLVPYKIDEVSGSQTFSQNFHRKVLSNLLRFSDVCLEMSKINLAFSEPIAPLSTLCSCTLKLSTDCGAQSRIDQMPGSHNFSKCH